MTLKQWIESQPNLTPAAFARSLGLTKMAVYRHIRGERTPRPDVMEMYRVATAGAVQPNDFY